MSDELEFDLASYKERVSEYIDKLAGEATNGMIPYPAVVAEYRYTQNEVALWREAGSDPDNVPSCLYSWIDASGKSADDAATDIESSAAAYKEALEAIRSIRLHAKAEVRSASSKAEVEAVMVRSRDELGALS